MLIVNQKRTTSVPIEQITLTVINGGDGESKILAFPIGEYMMYNGRWLGSYKTLERTKQVFTAIMDAYKRDTKTYFMPED